MSIIRRIIASLWVRLLLGAAAGEIALRAYHALYVASNHAPGPIGIAGIVVAVGALCSLVADLSGANGVRLGLALGTGALFAVGAGAALMLSPDDPWIAAGIWVVGAFAAGALRAKVDGISIFPGAPMVAIAPAVGAYAVYEIARMVREIQIDPTRDRVLACVAGAALAEALSLAQAQIDKEGRQRNLM